MSIELRQVKTRSQLRRFVNFPEVLYRHDPYYVPPLVFDQMDTLDQEKGAAQEFCKSELWMAYKDGKPAGRIAAIVNFKANEQWNHKEVRFGWYDFIDDPEVSQALMEKVYAFGRKHGMESVVGPLGFTDFDPEGMLIAGYDRLNTMALIYNYPYYNDHMEKMGFGKDTDWVEYKLFMEDQLPERLERIANIVKQRTNVHVKPLTRKIIRKEDYGTKVFKLINECYKDLYNFTVLPDHMAKKYLDFYLSILDLRYLVMLENDKDELVAFGITMPSLARALQKSRGKLFPFGWWHIVKSMFLKHEEGVEMLLIGVRPDYQNTGINSLLFNTLFPFFKKQGVKWAETNAVLETNIKNQGQMEQFSHECVKRRRSYIKPLD
ncbi:MAG: N-acetyltransferase [Bacteroidales bacterium]|nr:N-acetyltransferase [Bacteroidales bacterium]MBO4566548.1 N-acetyltransferase [Bacteroidales bacterium]